MISGRLSLRLKIALLISSLLLILFILSSYIVINYQKILLTRNLIQKGEILVSNFSLYCQNAFFTGDELNIEDYVEVLLKDEEINSIYIVLKNSTYYLHSDIKLLGKKYIRPLVISTGPKNSYNYILSGNKKNYQFNKPVYISGKSGKTVYLGEAYIELTTKTMDNKINSIKLKLVLIFISLFILGLIGSLSVSLFLSKPVKELIHGINIIAKGDLKHRININTRDEIEDLAGEFNKMTKQLLLFQKKQIRQKVIEQELTIAKNIQTEILPAQLPVINKYQLIHFHQTSSTIGGDYYNIFRISPQEYLAVIADVSGKGIPAALLMSMFHTVLLTLQDTYYHPMKLMKELNRIVSAFLKRGSFITVCFTLINTKTNHIQIVSAGHEYPALLNFKNKKMKFLKTTGIPIGLFDEKMFSSKLLPLNYIIKKNELLLFFTDGLRSLGKHPLNNKKLQKYFESILEISKSFTILKKHLMEQLTKKQYHDDLTVLGIYKD